MRTEPALGSSRPRTIARVVVLPAPLAPEQGRGCPARDREAHRIDGGNLAEPLGEGLDLQDGAAHRGPR